MSAISAHRAELEAIASNGAGTLGDDLPSSWTPVDLDAVLDGREVDEPPTRLHRTDGVPLLYAGKVHAISGEPESCKGWLALTAAAETMAGGETVFYVDFEDSAAGVVGRLLSLGVDPDTIRRLFVYVRPSEPLDARGWAALGAASTPSGSAMIDGITEAMALHGLSPDDNSDIAKWRSLLPRPLAAAGATVLEVDHVTKNPDTRGRFRSAAQHKLAQLDGAAYGVKVIDTFGRGRTGKVKIICHKDRPGHVRAHEDRDKCVAMMELVSSDDGAVRVVLEPPGDPGAWRPTGLMERVSLLLETYPGAGKREIREGITAKAEWIDKAILALAAEGYITVQPDGRSHKHFSVRKFREATG